MSLLYFCYRYGEDMDREIGVTDDPDNPVTLPTYEDIEQRAAHELGCSVYNSLKEPINMYDVLESIQVFNWPLPHFIVRPLDNFL